MIIRVFGCQAFVHVPKDERKKLDSKSKKCILLGYGTTTKGCSLYDPLKKRVLFSRDVIFNECKYVFEESTQQKSQKRVYLDYFDELSETCSSLEEVGPPATVGLSEMVSPSEIVDSPVSVLRHSEREKRKPDRYEFLMLRNRTV